MGERRTAAKTETYCDRCRTVFDQSKKVSLQTMWKHVTTRYTLVAALRGRFGMEVVKSLVDLCAYCQWELDCLFLQGLAVPPHPSVRQYDAGENPEPVEDRTDSRP